MAAALITGARASSVQALTSAGLAAEILQAGQIVAIHYGGDESGGPYEPVRGRPRAIAER